MKRSFPYHECYHDSACDHVSYRTMNSAWKKLWLDGVLDRDLDRFDADSSSSRHSQNIVDDSTIIDDIVTIGQSIGLEVEADDIEQLLEDHCIELIAKELEHLQDEDGRKTADKIEENELDKEDVSSVLIKEIISKRIDHQKNFFKISPRHSDIK